MGKQEAAELEEETGKKSNKAFTEGDIKGSVRAFKKKEAQRDKEIASRSVNDDDMRNEQKERKRKQKRKAATNLSDAAGDGELFSEERVAHAKPRKETTNDGPVKSSYVFHDYDPNKKLGKKKAHHAFKSRSKHKRR